MAIHPLAGIELFSGTGMLGEGFRSGLDYLGIPYRTICHVEREAYAASVMVARIQEGSLDEAPIWPDVTTFNAIAWRGKVDCVVAGFPCQDLSVAGRRAGLDGKRSGLFFEVIRIADDCGAWLMLLENVAGIASATASVVDAEEGELDERAASRVVGELADCGWNAEWITLSASDVGASHGRARWFCLAWRMANTSNIGHEWSEGSGWEEIRRTEFSGKECVGNPESERKIRTANEQWRTRASGCAGEQMGNTNQQRAHRSGAFGWQAGRGELAHDGICLADTGSARPQGLQLGRARNRNGGGQETHGSTSQLCGLFAPCPSDSGWAGILRDNPELAPALEPTFRQLVNGLAFNMDDCRAQRIKCSGNGVVALQAALATIVLTRRAGLQEMIAIKETNRKQA